MTFVETVLALANSASYDDFVARLKEIRYVNSQVSWENRNHYFTAEIQQNSQYISDITQAFGQSQSLGDKLLNHVADVPQHTMPIYYIPQDKIMEIQDQLQDGDIIAFATDEEGVDVIHEGIIKMNDGRAMLIHASTSAYSVTEEPLAGYRSGAGYIGIIIARPK